MALIKVPIPPETYYHVFERNDGTIFEVETTQREYSQLGQVFASPNGMYPTHPIGKWRYSYSGYKLPLGTYCDEKGLQWLVNVDGGTGFVQRKNIVNDNLTLEGITDLERSLKRPVKP